MAKKKSPGKPNIFTTTVHCRSDAAAEKELAKFYAECASGQVTKSDSTTIEALADKWIKARVSVKCKPSTVACYKQIIESRIKSYLGSRKLAKLQSMHIQEWVNDIKQDGLSPKTIKLLLRPSRDVGFNSKMAAYHS